jgi:hypothetical protein
MSGALLSVLTGGVSSLLGPVVSRLVDLIPDPVAKAQAAQAMQTALLQADQAMEAQQAQIDANEASNESLFVSGWRPYIGWVCGFSLGWSFFIGPLLTWVVALCGSKIALPVLDSTQTTALVVPMLGLGAYRTVEKVSGNAGSLASQKLVANTKIAIAAARTQ